MSDTVRGSLGTAVAGLGLLMLALSLHLFLNSPFSLVPLALIAVVVFFMMALLPVKIAAQIVRADRTDYFSCFIASVVGPIAAVLMLLFAEGVQPGSAFNSPTIATLIAWGINCAAAAMFLGTTLWRGFLIGILSTLMNWVGGIGIVLLMSLFGLEDFVYTFG